MMVPRSFVYMVSSVFILLVLAPVLHIILVPFWDDPGSSLVCVRNVFESRQWPMMVRSLSLGTGTTAFCLFVGVPVAFFLTRTDLKCKPLLFWGAVIPALIPPYIHAIAWTRLAPFLQGCLGFDIHSLSGSVLVLGCAYFPFVLLLIMLQASVV